MLVAVVLAVHPRAARPLALPVQRAQLGDVVGHLHVVDLVGGVGLVEVPLEELLGAVRLGDPDDHQGARADALLLVEPEVDREPPHDGDAEDGEENGDGDVDPNEVVVALQVRDGGVAKVVGHAPLALAALQRALDVDGQDDGEADDGHDGDEEDHVALELEVLHRVHAALAHELVVAQSEHGLDPREEPVVHVPGVVNGGHRILWNKGDRTILSVSNSSTCMEVSQDNAELA